MKRAVVHIASALLIGATATIAVAWACAVWLPLPPLAISMPASGVTAWPGPTPSTWPSPLELPSADGADPVLETHSQSLGRSNSIVACGDSGLAWYERYEYWVHTTGLPFRSMRFDFLTEDFSPPNPNSASPYPVVSVWRQGVKLVASPAPFRLRIPLMPVWPGFAADTALYAAAWLPLRFAVWTLYRAGRRRFRVSRGLCGTCAYDLKGSPTGTCPECGRAAPA